ncbi:TetR family transcriptional regulator [Streptomyces tsukubensis]|uniref:TetR family transcriptional regulator n=2 Tax=Streptomyces TaxID=1883 RepID=A0A7G3UDJ9_STRT9|nr:TetR family transcriptional regulator [Streptomyces tsukubensis]AZK96589.1 TetR family transcriptional regulator [Streptomyces tsukubensis]QKM67409.1 TetR family transcriptional regulator [Streptomyces tsukubensis NRRL18488]TAI42113.1 TetR family transcriptional regulator [Streptomyces tsukubensis]
MTTATEQTEPSERELPLRERKRLRTRRALVETALARYTRDGFEHTTLDDLTDEVEISKRTFFRYFASKEDVALAPEKEFWDAFLGVLAEAELAGPVLDVLHRSLVTALERMDGVWERRFAESRRLVERTPALAAHSLQHCAETADAILELLSARIGPLVADDTLPEAPGTDELRLRIALEIMVAAFRCALHAWSTGPADAGRAELVTLTGRAFAAVPGSLDLTARPAGSD